MKPRNAHERNIVELSKALPTITDEQKRYSENNSFLNWGVISRKKIYCLECATNWETSKKELTKTKCINCGKTLKIYEENKVLFQEIESFSVVTVKNGFQVERIFYSYKNMKKNEKPTYSHIECMQFWIDENGKHTTLALERHGFSRGLIDAWVFGSVLSIKDIDRNSQLFFINPYKIYPNKKIIPRLKRNGFKSSFNGISPHLLTIGILTDNTAETLLKTNQLNTLKHYLGSDCEKVKKLIFSIKICTKNNYIIKDFSIWKDYLNLLDYFEKDLRNPKYICPADIKREHDRLMNKKQQIQRRIKLELMKEELENLQNEYLKDKKSFFDFTLKSGKLKISVIKSVREFMEEGDSLNHCIFTNEYYKEKDSLILSARINNKPIETIQISLSEMKIKQARGRGNKATPHHRQILSLVKKNLHLINKFRPESKIKEAS